MKIYLGLVFALITGYFAARKHRSTLFWGAFGFFAPVVALIVLLFQPHVCPRCRQPLTGEQRDAGVCPRCGGVGRDAQDDARFLKEGG